MRVPVRSSRCEETPSTAAAASPLRAPELQPSFERESERLEQRRDGGLGAEKERLWQRALGQEALQASVGYGGHQLRRQQGRRVVDDA